MEQRAAVVGPDVESQHDAGGVGGEEVGAGGHAGVLSLGAHREGGAGG